MAKTRPDITIIVPPAKGGQSTIPPYGALHIISALKERGYSGSLLNMDIERLAPGEIINRIREVDPPYIGFSTMVAMSYKYIKNLSFLLKNAFPDKIQILGGGLSCAPHTVLKNTSVDIVVYGEGEATACELIESLYSNRPVSGVKGLYYRDGSSVKYTGIRPLIADIDKINYPAFDLIDIEKYVLDSYECMLGFTSDPKYTDALKNKKNKRMLNILINRGCVGSCNFCIRPYPGLRVPSVTRLFDYIEYCVRKFDLGAVSFSDECFSPNKARNWEFINEFKRRNLNIAFRIGGIRVDVVDRQILKAFKDIGCFMVSYGFESGSQKILNIIDKRVSVEQNIGAITQTNEAGIFTPVQLILGMPGETDQTIEETINTLKSLNLDYYHYKSTYALPMPGSALYEYAVLVGAIEDEDAYLEALGGIDGTQSLHINLTDENDETVGMWKERIARRMKGHYIAIKYKIRSAYLMKICSFLDSLGYHKRIGDLVPTLKTKMLLFIYSLIGVKQKTDELRQVYVKFRKKNDVNFEAFLNGLDMSIVNRKASLKNINEALRASAWRTSASPLAKSSEANPSS